MRPLGSIFFGHIGDKYGRRKAIVISIFLMTIATVSIGLLPTAHIHTYLLISILLGFRLLQGLAVSGEYSGILTFIAETAPPKHYYFFQSFSAIGSLGGVLLGTAIGSVALSLHYTNAWRLPFIASVFLGAAGFYLRLKSGETATYYQILRQNKIIAFPLKRILLRHKRTILFLVMIVAIDTTGFYFIVIFYPSFIVHLGLSEIHYLHATSLGLVIALIMTPIIGAITDRIPLILMLSVGMISYMIIPLAVMGLVSHEHNLAFIVGLTRDR